MRRACVSVVRAQVRYVDVRVSRTVSIGCEFEDGRGMERRYKVDIGSLAGGATP